MNTQAKQMIARVLEKFNPDASTPLRVLINAHLAGMGFGYKRSK